MRYIDPNKERSKDVLTDYLDRETKAATIQLHSEDIKNELMNKDILLNHELPSYSEYQTPLDVVDKYGRFPSLDEITKESGFQKVPINEKIVLSSHSKKKNL